jgi:hypothetical protein
MDIYKLNKCVSGRVIVRDCPFNIFPETLCCSKAVVPVPYKEGPRDSIFFEISSSIFSSLNLKTLNMPSRLPSGQSHIPYFLHNQDMM